MVVCGKSQLGRRVHWQWLVYCELVFTISCGILWKEPVIGQDSALIVALYCELSLHSLLWYFVERASWHESALIVACVLCTSLHNPMWYFVERAINWAGECTIVACVLWTWSPQSIVIFFWWEPVGHDSALIVAWYPHSTVCFQMLYFTYFRGSRFSQCFILSTALHCLQPSKLYAINNILSNTNSVQCLQREGTCLVMTQNKYLLKNWLVNEH